VGGRSRLVDDAPASDRLEALAKTRETLEYIHRSAGGFEGASFEAQVGEIKVKTTGETYVPLFVAFHDRWESMKLIDATGVMLRVTIEPLGRRTPDGGDEGMP
jgi:hypothetical protein